MGGVAVLPFTALAIYLSVMYRQPIALIEALEQFDQFNLVTRLTTIIVFELAVLSSSPAGNGTSMVVTVWANRPILVILMATFCYSYSSIEVLDIYSAKTILAIAHGHIVALSECLQIKCVCVSTSGVQSSCSHSAIG